jgi:hypothetical protein
MAQFLAEIAVTVSSKLLSLLAGPAVFETVAAAAFPRPEAITGTPSRSRITWWTDKLKSKYAAGRES